MLESPAGNLLLASGKRAVLFATVTRPGAEEELTYVLVLRHTLFAAELAGQLPPFDLGTSGEGRTKASRDSITINGKRIEARYEVEWNETFTGLTREALTVGGQSKELDAGRVFLVDMAGQSPAYIQKNLKLMPSITTLESPADVERLAEAIFSSLEDQDGETKAFIK
jgi:hypothetical protein